MLQQNIQPKEMTNSALVYEPNAAGRGRGVAGVSAKKYSCAHGAQINIGDLTPYFTYDSGGQLYETTGPGSQHSYIHVLVGDLYIPTFGLPILLQENRWTYSRNI
jgi:hypothetical protein